MTIDPILFFGVLFTMLLLIMCLMVFKMFYDTTGTKTGQQNIYLLKVTQSGEIKIKRYRGNIKYWNDLS